MSDTVQFWLDNKMSAGIKVAAIGGQTLVVYREKYYVVEKDAAHTKGGKALRYSKTSLPALWKRALRGESLPAEALIAPADDALPVSSVSKRARAGKTNSPLSVTPTPVAQAPVPDQAASPPSTQGSKTGKSVKNVASKQVSQATVLATCPHCNQRHDLPLEKGKNGKPFFMACSRCGAEFAVRFVPVMVYQAQVAGFL